MESLNKKGFFLNFIVMNRFLIFFLFLSLGSKAQTGPNLDSLKSKVEGLRGYQKVQVLNEITFLLREQDLTEAFHFGNEAEKLALSLKDSVAIGRAKGNLGWIYYRTGVWDKAFRYSRDAYLIAVKQKDDREIAMSLNNLGAIYYKQRNYIEAIKKFKESYAIGVQLNEPYVTIRSLNNIALNYSRSGELDSALYYANEALKQNTKSGSSYYTSFSKRVIGDVLLEKNQLDEAIATYENALSVVSHHRLDSFETSIYHRLGKAYWLKGDSKKAIEILEKAKEIGMVNNFQDELVNTYKNLALVYESQGKIDLAFQNQMAYNRLQDLINERVDRDRLALVSGMFEVEKTDAELRFLKSENALKEIEIKNFRTFSWLITIGVLILGGLLVWLFYLHQKAKAINIDLRLQQEKVNRQKLSLEKQSEELDRMNKLKDRLFSILGHDLKAPVAQLQGVLGLMHNQDLNKEEFDAISHVLKRNVDGLYVTLDNILSWSRSQMEGFKVHLSPVNYVETINQCLELLHHQAKIKDLTIHLEIIQGVKIWADQDLLQIVIRNLISNAIKFSSKGSIVRIFAKEEANNMILTIQDFGVGMTQEKLEKIKNDKFSLLESSRGTENEKGTGIGINLCKEFVDLMGGQISFESERNKGTLVSLTFKKVQVISDMPTPHRREAIV